jgi:hypothetical protein
MDRLFARLALAYGRRWVRAWEGIDPLQLKNEWAHRLAPYATPAGMRAITWVLDNALPTEWPPTSLQFVVLVKAAMPAEAPPLALPEDRKANPARARALMARLRSMLASMQSCNAWAEALLARQQAGEKLSMAQREAVRDYLARKACAGVPSAPADAGGHRE